MRVSTHPKILVTGACGFIGSNFVRRAVQEGRQVIALDALTYAGHLENLEGITGPGSLELVRGDIRNFELLTSLFQAHAFDAVLNFAAETHVDRSIEGPRAFIETNISGTFTLLQATLNYWQTLEGSKKERFRYLQISTDEVYGSLGATGYFSEVTPMAPNSPYSASKAGADLLVRAWHHTYGLPVLTTNCSNNYGPYQFPEKLIPHMILCALSGRPLPVYGDGLNVRDWIHVDDHCSGVFLALERGKAGETYCLGGNAERDNLNVVETICRTLDELQPSPHGSYLKNIQFVKDRPGHDRRYAIDSTRAQDELGFTRQFSFEKGLRETIRWYLDHQKWIESVMKETEA